MGGIADSLKHVKIEKKTDLYILMNCERESRGELNEATTCTYVSIVIDRILPNYLVDNFPHIIFKCTIYDFSHFRRWSY